MNLNPLWFLGIGILIAVGFFYLERKTCEVTFGIDENGIVFSDPCGELQ